MNNNTFTALTLFHVIKSMDWEDKTGHYIYYKLDLKKPKKTTLIDFTPTRFKQYVETLNDELEITNPAKYTKLTKLHVQMQAQSYEYSSSSSDDEPEDIKILTIDDFDYDFKFNRKSPYSDIINTDNLKDCELARVISIRSQLTVDVWDMCIY